MWNYTLRWNQDGHRVRLAVSCANPQAARALKRKLGGGTVQSRLYRCEGGRMVALLLAFGAPGEVGRAAERYVEAQGTPGEPLPAVQRAILLTRADEFHESWLHARGYR